MFDIPILRFAIAMMYGSIISLLPFSSYSQSYPSKPIRLVVGFPPGGGVDVLARQIAPKLGEQLGHQVVIDNRPGAAGNIAAELVAKSPPDGYSLILSTPSITINPALYSKLPFDTVADFAPVTLVGEVALLVVVHPSLPVQSIKELIALAKATPAQLLYSSGGNGSAAHLSGELLKTLTGIDAVHVPFKGAPPSLLALVRGDVHFTFGALPSTQPSVKAGKLRALAVTSAKRSVFAPDLPTVAEIGITGYEYTQWYGLLAPAKTPVPIISKLNAEFINVLQMPEIRALLAKQSIEITTNTPEQFAAFIKSELAKWNRVVKETGMRID
ncbi:MAG: hypothetical protein A3G24_12415 [Betaproteobacteria bacterium RIFCSPLOWO2_12_FULL_62_13]|nr:MAG: hypothetical protein A3G24_12415 [Betaproteobacteria bacterium RIFCSPLOWO2_12_FULL_62_13]